MSSSNVGLWVLAALLLLLLGLVGMGTVIELTSCGDDDNYKGGDAALSLYHASLFRRLY
jgi:hypothetical protein